MIKITKQNGELEDFDPNKLRDSLLRSKASEELTEEIIAHVEKELREGMGTDQIYKHAFFLLEKKSKPVALSYSLRRAILTLGPSGFPFEKYLGEILKEKGYTVKTDQIIRGKCAEHEIDVIAYNKNKLIAIEAKFHNSLGVKSDLKTALYVKARSEDLANIEFDYGGKRKFDENWLVTNTKFSSSAINYGKCAGMIMIGWNYPNQGNLQDIIQDSGLHPITCLQSLSNTQKTAILSSGTVLCKSLRPDSEVLKSLRLNKEKLEEIGKEVSVVCPI
ncbi:MAG: ATP cone domain-containing protein [Patescibacteria group bacterium]